jgi:hypothetical protein
MAVAACSGRGGGGGTPTGGLPYLDDVSYRRAELVSDLWSPQNEYSQLRLAHYATGDANDWDLLPEWNPPVDVVAASELDAPGGASTTVMSASASALSLPETVASEDDPALIALGEAAFHEALRSRLHLVPHARRAHRSPRAARRRGDGPRARRVPVPGHRQLPRALAPRRRHARSAAA